MNSIAAQILLISGFTTVTFVTSPKSVFAQAPPGPIAPAAQSRSSEQAPAPAPAQAKQYPPQKKENLVGVWKLNHDESDDARKKLQQARNSTGGRNGPYGGGGGNGPYGRGPMGGGYPFPGSGGGNGPYGRHGGGMGGGEAEDREQMQDLVDPAVSLAFVQKDAEVDVTDDQGRKHVYYTDGRKLQKSKDAKYQEAAAHWEGARLVSNEKGPHGGKITRSFELTPDGKQLYEIVRLETTRSGLLNIRYVYDATRESTAK